MSKRINTVSMVISAFLCALLGATGKLNGSFEISQTYMLLYLCNCDWINTLDPLLRRTTTTEEFTPAVKKQNDK